MTTKSQILIVTVLGNLGIAVIYLVLTFTQLSDQEKAHLDDSGHTYKQAWIATLDQAFERNIGEWHPTAGERSKRSIWRERIDARLVSEDAAARTIDNPLVEAMTSGNPAELETVMQALFAEDISSSLISFALYISPENRILQCVSLQNMAREKIAQDGSIPNKILSEGMLSEVNSINPCSGKSTDQFSHLLDIPAVGGNSSSALHASVSRDLWIEAGSEAASGFSVFNIMAVSLTRNGSSIGTIILGGDLHKPVEFFELEFDVKVAIKFNDQIITHDRLSELNSYLESTDAASINHEVNFALERNRGALQTNGVFGYMDRVLSASVFGFPISEFKKDREPFFIVLRDQTEFLQNQRETIVFSLLVGLVFFLILLAITVALTTSAFGGVRQAINMMRALAQGDRSVSMPQRKQLFKSEDDEIDRLAQALEAYKAHLDELDEIKLYQQYKNRERDTIIMDKMRQLAAGLEGEARQLILSDIAKMEQMAARITPDSTDDRSVELMTVAFSRMSNEVTALLEARTREMKKAYEQAAQINREMRSSINYASMLQRAMLKAESFPDDFKIHLTWQPRDVVGGDIYVVRTTEHKTVIAVIDCTGHGVPGAFTSLIARAAFDRAFEDPAIVSAGDYLSESNRLIKNMLFQNEAEQAESDAGFDGTVCILDRVSGTLEFAGANASLFVVDSGQVTELKGDKKSVGARRTPGGYEFTTQLVTAPKGMFVMLSDGVTDVMSPDQSPMAFGRKRLVRLMESIDTSDPKVIVSEIMQAVDQYKGSGELRDDLTLLAFYIDQLQQFDRAALPNDSAANGSL